MAMSENVRGALLMAVSMAAFTINDAAMKSVTETIPLFQSIALRGVVTLILLGAVGVATGTLHLRLPARDTRLVLLRSVAEVAATLLFLTALLHMPIANLSAILQSLPLAVTLAAALLFGERIGWRRLLAIAIGFVGVCIIIRPGGEAFDKWSLMGLGSVVCVVVRDLSARRISTAVPSVTVAFWSALAVTLMGASALPVQGFAPMDTREIWLVLGASGCLIFGLVASVTAMRQGEISFVAPFRYTSLVWAVLLGWAVFGDWPDMWTWVGAALVVATGMFAFWRESVLRRARLSAGSLQA